VIASCLLASLAGAACGEPAVPAGDLPYRTDGTFLRDGRGRALVLRGVNFPAEDVDDWTGARAGEDAAALDRIAASGFNAIRLVVNWDRVEPEPGHCREDYLDLVARLARLADERRLYVVVDMHQDLFGPGFGPHGIPRWACDEALYAAFEPRDPWFLSYFTPQVSACFDRFWHSAELQASAREAAREIARRVAPLAHVVGFDPMNEPFQGAIPDSTFEGEFLAPFYADFARMVGEAMPGRTVFFEPPVTFSVAFETRLDAPPGGVFAPHYYDAGVEMDHLWNGDAEAPARAVRGAAGAAASMGAPWAYGEIGGAKETPNLEAYLHALFAEIDRRAGGAFLWLWAKGETGFGILDADGRWSRHAPGFLRVAPSAVAGTPISFSWNYAELTFRMEWEEDRAAGDTEILLPEWVGRVGWRSTLDGAPAVPRQAAHRLLLPGGRGGARRFELVAEAPWPGE